MYRRSDTTPPLDRKECTENGKKHPSTSSRDCLTAGDSETEADVDAESIQRPPLLQPYLDGKGDQLSYINQSFVCDIEAVKSCKETWKSDFDPEKNSPVDNKNGGKLESLKVFLAEHKTFLKLFSKVIIFILYNIYFGFAINTTWDAALTWCDGVKFLSIITFISYIFAFYSYIFKPYLRRSILQFFKPFVGSAQKLAKFKHFSKAVWILVLIAVVAFLIFDTADERYRLVSAGGVFFLVLFGYVFSKHRSQIVWRHLMWGLTIQFCIALLILRWSIGQSVFICLGDKVKTFIDITDKGSTFVFGYLVSGEMDGIKNQPAVFAFKVLSVIIFFSFIVSILYYYGVMQVMVAKVGWLLQKTIGTTACESMNAAGNIFLGMTEAPLLIRPFLPLMTKSELHAVMTGGFATIAGSVLAAYINFGISASHLLTASVMAAPAALAFSKLTYPETEESQTQADNIKIEKGSETNALEAATNGASAAIALVTNIAANLIAFVAFITLIDTIFSWFGSLVAWNDASFEWLLSKLFIPVSLLMGVDWADKEHVANLVGLKTIVNEFVAYKKLADYQAENLISKRSAAIATYALCGFSNVSAIGIQMGALSAMAPQRKSDLSQIAVRAMMTGTLTCILNACVAGTLLKH